MLQMCCPIHKCHIRCLIHALASIVKDPKYHELQLKCFVIKLEDALHNLQIKERNPLELNCFILLILEV